MGFRIIFVSLSVVSLFCLGYSFTITDAEYAEAIYDHQGVKIASAGTADCYFKAALDGCKKGKKLYTALLREDGDKEDMKEDNEETEVESTKAACLKAKCISGKKVLSHKVEIGGDGVSAKPDTLKKGYSSTEELYTTLNECKASDTLATVEIKCKESKLEMEEYMQMPEYGAAIEDIEALRSQAPADISQDDNSNDDEDSDNNEDGNKITEAAAELEDHFKDNDVEAMEKDPGTGVTAKIQFHNWFRSCLNMQCPNRYAISHVLSGFSAHYLDRIWRLSCKLASDHNYNHCYWTGYQNAYDWPLMTMCNPDYVMIGLYAVYHGGHRDRVFRTLCCRAHAHSTRTCRLSGYINGWRGWMNYGVGGHHRVFTGLFSYHHNGYEDRRWKMLDCAYLR